MPCAYRASSSQRTWESNHCWASLQWHPCGNSDTCGAGFQPAGNAVIPESESGMTAFALGNRTKKWALVITDDFLTRLRLDILPVDHSPGIENLDIMAIPTETQR